MKSPVNGHFGGAEDEISSAISINTARGGYKMLYLHEKALLFVYNTLLMTVSLLTSLFYIPLVYVLYYAIDLAPIPMQIKSSANGYLKIFVHHYFLTVISFLVPNEIYIAQDLRILDLDRGIVISNHLSDFDWLFIQHYFHSIDKLKYLCIVIKESVSRVPLLGYILRKMGHAFVRRTEDSGPAIFQSLGSLRECSEVINKMAKGFMFIFPEGAFQHKNSIRDSSLYLEKYPYVFEGKPYVPNNVLTPRENGFKTIYDSFDTSEGVIDLTIIANPFTKKVGALKNLFTHFLFGTREVNFVIVANFVQKEKFRESPRYLQELFCKKDELITRFEQLTLEKSGEDSDPYKISSIQDLEDLLLEHSPNMSYGYKRIQFYTPFWPFYVSFVPVFYLLSYLLVEYLVNRIYRLFAAKSVIHLSNK